MRRTIRSDSVDLLVNCVLEGFGVFRPFSIRWPVPSQIFEPQLRFVQLDLQTFGLFFFSFEANDRKPGEKLESQFLKKTARSRPNDVTNGFPVRGLVDQIGHQSRSINLDHYGPNRRDSIESRWRHQGFAATDEMEADSRNKSSIAIGLDKSRRKWRPPPWPPAGPTRRRPCDSWRRGPTFRFVPPFPSPFCCAATHAAVQRVASLAGRFFFVMSHSAGQFPIPTSSKVSNSSTEIVTEHILTSHL